VILAWLKSHATDDPTVRRMTCLHWKIHWYPQTHRYALSCTYRSSWWPGARQKQLPVCLGVLHDVLVHNDGQPRGPSLDPVSLSGSNSPCCCRLNQGKDEGKEGLWSSLDLMLWSCRKVQGIAKGKRAIFE
jgi:hypothetical protein